jgi:hypothetical protein
MPVPVAIGVPQESQTTDPTEPVGSPPFENAFGLTSPKPEPDGAITPDRPSVGSGAVAAVVAVTAAMVVVVDVDALALCPLADPTELAAERGELEVHAIVRTEVTLTAMLTTNRHFTMRFLLVARSRTGYGLVPTPPGKCRSACAWRPFGASCQAWRA